MCKSSQFWRNSCHVFEMECGNEYSRFWFDEKNFGMDEINSNAKNEFHLFFIHETARCAVKYGMNFLIVMWIEWGAMVAPPPLSQPSRRFGLIDLVYCLSNVKRIQYALHTVFLLLKCELRSCVCLCACVYIETFFSRIFGNKIVRFIWTHKVFNIICLIIILYIEEA